MQGVYTYAAGCAVLLAALILLAVLPAGNSGDRLAASAARYVSTALAVDVQRAAVIGYVAGQPSYALETLVLDAARLYGNVIFVGGGNASYTFNGTVSGYFPSIIQPAGAPLALSAGSLYMFCSPKGNRLVTGEVAYNLQGHAVTGRDGVEFSRVLGQPGSTIELYTTTTARISRGLLAFSSLSKTVAKGSRVLREVRTLASMTTGKLLSYTLKTKTLTGNSTLEGAEVDVALQRGAYVVHYRIVRGNETVENTTIIPQDYTNQVLATAALLARSVNVRVAGVGKIDGVDAYNITVTVDGRFKLAGYNLKLRVVYGGTYIRLGGILYPLNTSLKDYRATLEGPGKTCEIILGGPALLNANLTLSGTGG